MLVEATIYSRHCFCNSAAHFHASPDFGTLLSGTFLHFHGQDEAGERECDAVAEPDRRSAPQHAVIDPEACTDLEHEERGRLKSLALPDAPRLHHLRQERECCQAAGHEAQDIRCRP